MQQSRVLAATIGILLSLAGTPRGLKAQGWSHFTSTDEMTGETQAFATSPRAAPTRPMAFPYGGVRAWLGFGCDGQDEWVYIGFTDAPNLTNSEPQSGGYSTFTARTRWDDEVRRMEMSQEWGERFLHFQSDATAIRRIEAARSLLLELKWYGSGDVYFRFSLDGSSDAIASARALCRASE